MSLQSVAILVKLSISLPGNTRTDIKITQDTLAAHAMSAKAGRWLKQLYPDEAIQPLTKLQGEIRTWNDEHTLPWSDEGFRILPTAHHAAYTDAMRDFKARFENESRIFINRLPEWIEWAKQAHNGTFDGSCYPTADKLARKFALKVEFSPVPSGDDFRCSISDEERDAMSQQVNTRVQEATEAAAKNLWSRLADPLRAMVSKLSEPDRDGGKAPIFRDTLVSNLQDIAKLVPALNISSDQRLIDFAKEVQALSQQTTPDALRASKSQRDETAKRAADILSRMSGYLALRWRGLPGRGCRDGSPRKIDSLAHAPHASHNRDAFAQYTICAVARPGLVLQLQALTQRDLLGARLANGHTTTACGQLDLGGAGGDGSSQWSPWDLDLRERLVSDTSAGLGAG